MKRLSKIISFLAFFVVAGFVILHIVPLPISVSMLAKNPTPITLNTIDGTKITAQIKWDNPTIRLRGFQARAEIVGTFNDAPNVLNRLINPTQPIAVINKNKLKVWQLDNSTLSCTGNQDGLQCLGKIRIRIDTVLGQVKNTLTLTSQSSSVLDGNEITLSHRILNGQGVPSQVVDALNGELTKKDKVKTLPNFFVDHNTTVTDHAFIGNSDDNTLGLRMTLTMPIAELLESIF